MPGRRPRWRDQTQDGGLGGAAQGGGERAGLGGGDGAQLAVKVADRLPADTVTEAGTVSAALLLESPDRATARGGRLTQGNRAGGGRAGVHTGGIARQGGDQGGRDQAQDGGLGGAAQGGGERAGLGGGDGAQARRESRGSTTGRYGDRGGTVSAALLLESPTALPPEAAA